MFDNKDVKRYTRRYIFGVIVFGIALFFALQFCVNQMEKTYFDVLSEIGANLGLLEKSGYYTYHLSDNHQAVRHKFWLLYGVVYLLFILSALAGYILGLLLYRVPRKTLRTARHVSALVLEGDAGEAVVPEEFLKDLESETGAFWEAYEKMVTAIAQAREDAEKEKLFLQDLIADISHQLKTPLATLTIYQDLLDNPSLSDVERSDMLKCMGEQLTRMDWLILNLLKLARLEAGSIRFVLVRQNLLQTLLLAKDNVRMLLEAKGQHMEICCDAGMELIHDREWLVEALTNVMKNATEYAPENSTINVWAEQSPVMTRIYIKDYGIGIAPEEQHKVFQRFYRAKSKVNENSIGIGLSLSKCIVNGQDGDIYVESEPGVYTCFIIVFS